MKIVHEEGRTVLKADEPNAKRRLLEDAIEACCGDRHLNYGNPENNFKRISMLQDAWIGCRYGVEFDRNIGGSWSLDPFDTVALNILQKLGRLSNNPRHRDSIIDIAGYAACWADLLEPSK